MPEYEVTVEVYLFRHGIAEEGRPGQPDQDRALVPEGRRKLREVLKVAKAAGLEPGLILSSPYRRARQTAEVAVAALGYKGEVVLSPTLVPGGDPAEVWAELRAFREGQVLLVSHEPLCGRLLGYMVGAPEFFVDYRKGALARIDLLHTGSSPRGVLQWLLTPRLAGAGG
jgi:phosphohistidine phosphatase